MALFNPAIKLLANIVVLMVIVHIANVVTQGALLHFGIVPRQIETLPHILIAPWVHGSWLHLFNNLLGMLVFGGFCLIRGPKYFILSSALIIIVTGTLVWVFGRPAMHIGASGWVFGLWSQAIALAWFQRSFINITIAIFVLFFYGGMIFGVLPADTYISYESHLFGAFSGILAAFLLTRGGRAVSRKRA